MIKDWSQSKRPSRDEWLNTMRYFHAVEYYWIKMKELLGAGHEMDDFQKHFNEWKKTDPKECILYESIYMKF